MRRPLIEECYKLSTFVLKRSLDGRGGVRGPVISDQITLSDGKKELFVNYWLEQEEEESYLTLSLAGREPQRVRLTTFLPPFGGERLYFECPECGRRCEKLYLAPDSQDFKCHKHFIYEATTINRQSIHGQFLYRQNRLIKLVNQRTDINRIWYNDNYTKRFCRWLKMCARAGYPNEAKTALKLWEEVNLTKVS